jgi:hypothetical protein
VECRAKIQHQNLDKKREKTLRWPAGTVLLQVPTQTIREHIVLFTALLGDQRF